MKNVSTPKQRQLIQIRRRAAGMTDENHRDYMGIQFGKSSTVDLTKNQAEEYLKHLESLGYGGKRPFVRGDYMSQDDYIMKLWIELHKCGKVKQQGIKGLNAFISSVIGVDHIQWCDKKQKSKLIGILRRWGE